MEVQLYQRSQLPPSRIGAVKPLDIPEISPVEAIAEFGSSILQKIRLTRAGNEQSEYLGFVATAQERAATQIADNPGMSFEDMDKIQKQMMTEIDQAGKNLELPESKLYARNFTLKNRKLIEEKFNTQKEAILTQHEFARFNLERERLIAERKPDELNKLYESVSGELLDPEVATLSFENDVLTIEASQAKFDEEVAREEHQKYLEQFAEAGRDMTLAEATKFFNEISREEITEAERNGLIAQRKRQEEIGLDELKKVWDKTEEEAFNLNYENKLTPEWIREQFNANNLSKADRDSYLSMLSRPKEVPLNWDVYDRLSEMVEDYEKEKVTKGEVRLAITKALGKDIPETIAVKLRDKLNTIDEPDNPMNRSDVKRALGVLSDIESEELRLARLDDADIEELKDLRLKWLKKKDELERWIKEQEKLTDKDIQNKIDQMTKIAAEEVVLNWFERLMWTKRPQLFGLVGTQEERLAKKKAKAGIKELPEPMSLTEFEDTVRELDEEEAKTYYEKWKDKW